MGAGGGTGQTVKKGAENQVFGGQQQRQDGDGTDAITADIAPAATPAAAAAAAEFGAKSKGRPEQAADPSPAVIQPGIRVTIVNKP
jgi:hypothetical protein